MKVLLLLIWNDLDFSSGVIYFSPEIGSHVSLAFDVIFLSWDVNVGCFSIWSMFSFTAQSKNLFGMNFTKTPTTSPNKPIAIQNKCWWIDRGVHLTALPPKVTKTIWTTIVMISIKMNKGLLKKFLNTLNSLSLIFQEFISLKIYIKTKVLKIIVFKTPFSNVQSSQLPFDGNPKRGFPKKSRIERTVIWYKACPKIFQNITAVTIISFLPWGLSLRSSSFGGSVARARAANVSMIRFTQSI